MKDHDNLMKDHANLMNDHDNLKEKVNDHDKLLTEKDATIKVILVYIFTFSVLKIQY